MVKDGPVKLSYNPRLKQLARELRKKSTLAEVLLWQQLKGGQLRAMTSIGSNRSVNTSWISLRPICCWRSSWTVVPVA